MTPPLSCRDCGATISRASKGGRCRKCGRAAWSPEAEQRRLAASDAAAKRPEVIAARRRIAFLNRTQHIAWMPIQYRAHYKHLRRRKGFKAAEAQRLIRDQMKADSRGLDPFAAAIIFAGLREAA